MMKSRLDRVLVVLVSAACVAAGCSTISKSIRNRLPPPHEVENGILFQYEAPAARMVTLAGSFNNWAGTKGGGRYDSSIDPMSDEDGDGVWSIVKPLPPGRYQYKFVIDNGVRWETDPSNPNTGVESGITNSLVIVPENVKYRYEVVTGTVLGGETPATPKPRAAAKAGEATFELDLPNAKQVFVAGQFNEWSITKTPLEKGADGVWRVTLKLKPGKYEYKFNVDGQWLEDPKNPDKVPDPYGGNNSVLTVE
ncbi:MAG TPA: glycogen-binding domain-containing protein [bacterium]|nr:glycogen-binding domain-containing protein [bacterium]